MGLMAEAPLSKDKEGEQRPKVLDKPDLEVTMVVTHSSQALDHWYRSLVAREAARQV